MTLRSGLAKSAGLGFESTYGVSVDPTVWFPFRDDSLKTTVGRLMSTAVISGARLPRSQQWSAGDVTVGGALDLELDDRSMGKLLRASFGAVVTAGAGPYTHTFTPGDLDDDFFSLQIIRPDVTAGTANPFTYTGCTVKSWEIGCQTGEIATYSMEVVARDEVLVRTVTDGVTNSTSTLTSATAAFGDADLFKVISGTNIPANTYVGRINSATSVELSSSNVIFTAVNASGSGSAISLTIGRAATAVSYAAAIRPMTFVGASATIAGTAVNVKHLTIGGANPLAEDRRFLGQARIKQPLENGLRDYGGTVTMEFEDETQYRRYLNANEFALVFSLSNGVQPNPQTVVFTANVRFDGTTPDVKGMALGEIALPYKCVGTTTDASGLTCVYSTSEATP